MPHDRNGSRRPTRCARRRRRRPRRVHRLFPCRSWQERAPGRPGGHLRGLLLRQCRAGSPQPQRAVRPARRRGTGSEMDVQSGEPILHTAQAGPCSAGLALALPSGGQRPPKGQDHAGAPRPNHEEPGDIPSLSAMDDMEFGLERGEYSISSTPSRASTRDGTKQRCSEPST